MRYYFVPLLLLFDNRFIDEQSIFQWLGKIRFGLRLGYFYKDDQLNFSIELIFNQNYCISFDVHPTLWLQQLWSSHLYL